MSISSVSPQNWHYVAVSMETTNINFIIDSTTEQDTSGSSFTLPTSGNLNIGFSSSQSSSAFQDQMVELRVWKSRSVADLLAYSHS